MEIEGELPVRLIKGHSIARATPKQVLQIKEILGKPRLGLEFNYGLKKVESPGSDPNYPGYTNYILNASRWLYWVINFEGSNHQINKLQFALNLLENDLEIGFTIGEDTDGFPIDKHSVSDVNNQTKTSSIFRDEALSTSLAPTAIIWSKLIKINPVQFKPIQKYFDLISAVEESHPPIYRAFSEFNLLNLLPRFSSFATLALFAIIESLITHRPNDKEIGDSINHQIRTKIPLLERRFQRRLDVKKFFPECETANVWTKLYSYRSCLAHGDEPDFKKSLKVLKNDYAIRLFLRETVKLLLLQAVLEPDLISDLKTC